MVVWSISEWFLCSCLSLHTYVIASGVQTQHVPLESLLFVVALIALKVFFIIGFGVFLTYSFNQMAVRHRDVLTFHHHTCLYNDFATAATNLHQVSLL